MVKWKCKMSDEKLTPVYFPLYDKTNEDEDGSVTISKEEKNDAIDAFVQLDFIMMIVTFFFMYVIIKENSSEPKPITNLIRTVLGLLRNNKTIAFALVSLLIVGHVLWIFFKDSYRINIHTFRLYSFMYFVSAILVNFGVLVLTAIPSLYNIPLGWKRIPFTGFIASAKILQFKKWNILDAK